MRELSTAVPSHTNPTDTQLRELIDAPRLASLWNVKVSWVREYTRTRAIDPIPHFRMGRYRRFDLNDPRLANWLSRRRTGN